MCKKWASLKVMWCDCQGTINQPLFLTPSPASAHLSLRLKPRNVCLNKLGSICSNLHSNYFSWICTFLTLHFCVSCTVFFLALQYICQCAVHGRESTECRLQKAWKGNVQKMALELKNGQKNHFFWEMAIGVGLCAQLMKMNYLQRKCAKCSFGCFNKVNIVDRVQKWIIMKI